jgi:DmsE family decaheme c-type cytochrome
MSDWAQSPGGRRAARIVVSLLIVAAALMAVARPRAAAPQTGQAAAALAKDAVCTECHDQSSKKQIYFVYQTRHGVKADAAAPSCQDCHGKSDIHIKDPGKTTEVAFGAKSKNLSPPDVRNATCLTCHQASASRAHWAGSQHQVQGVACTSCHNIHAPEQKVVNKTTQADVCFTCHKAQRSQTHRISAHPLVKAGLTGSSVKMSCSDCHNPHGSAGPNLLVKNSVTETCYTCHAEKRGPFLWEHAPVADSCTLCHTPHGSANTPLLKARTPGLCQDCHTGDHANQVQSGANLATGAVTTINGAQMMAARAPRQQFGGRNCLSCHSLVHGSNHPAGAKFSR